jgi:hypothetical protein
MKWAGAEVRYNADDEWLFCFVGLGFGFPLCDDSEIGRDLGLDGGFRNVMG